MEVQFPGLQEKAAPGAGQRVPLTRRKVQKPECNGEKGQGGTICFSNLSVGSGICTNGSLSSL